MSSFESFPSSPLLPSSSSPPTLSCSSPSSSSPSPTPSPTPPPLPPPVASTPSSATSPSTPTTPPTPPRPATSPSPPSPPSPPASALQLQPPPQRCLHPRVLCRPRHRRRAYADRLLVVCQCLDASLSPSSYYPAPGYRLLSPVLGLLFYNPDGSQLRIASITLPISIDFSESAGNAPAGAASVCIFWDLAGKVRLSELASGGKVCLGYKEGHYGLLVEERVRVRMPAVKWLKTAVGGAVGGVVGVVLLLLLLMVIVKKKKRVRMVEMERRAYEEEASRFPWSVLRE